MCDEKFLNSLVKYVAADFFDVIIHNNSNIAVALRYELQQDVPLVVAKGFEADAKYLIESAKFRDVHKSENETLAKELFNIKINEAIPKKTFSEVAAILAIAYKITR